MEDLLFDIIETSRITNSREPAQKKILTTEEIEFKEELRRREKTKELEIKEMIARPWVSIISDVYKEKGIMGVQDMLKELQITEEKLIKAQGEENLDPGYIRMDLMIDKIINSKNGTVKFIKFIYNRWLSCFPDTKSWSGGRNKTKNKIQNKVYREPGRNQVKKE